MLTPELAGSVLKQWHDKSETGKEAFHQSFREDFDLFCPFCSVPLFHTSVATKITHHYNRTELEFVFHVPIEAHRTTTFITGPTFGETERRSVECAQGWRSA
jgi:hypothetical protein